MALFALFLSAALLAGAESLDCTDCTSASCRVVTCNGSQDTCIALRDENTLGASQSSGTFQSCAVKANSLSGIFMFDFGDKGKLSITSELCNTTNCPVLYPTSTAIDLYYNGKYCPKCYRPGHSSCADNGTVSCKGAFATCGVIHAELSQGQTIIPFAAKGCVSESVKNLIPKLPITMPGGDLTYKFIQVSVTPANGALASLRRVAFTLDSKDFAPQVAFFLPSLLGIFMVKLLS